MYMTSSKTRGSRWSRSSGAVYRLNEFPNTAIYFIHNYFNGRRRLSPPDFLPVPGIWFHIYLVRLVHVSFWGRILMHFLMPSSFPSRLCRVGDSFFVVAYDRRRSIKKKQTAGIPNPIGFRVEIVQKLWSILSTLNWHSSGTIQLADFSGKIRVSFQTRGWNPNSFQSDPNKS